MTERVVDIVDVTPIDHDAPPAERPDVPPLVVGRSDPAVPAAAVARPWGVAASVGRTLAWLIAAALTLAAGWRPVTSELHIIPPVYGVPLGYIRLSTNGWGQVHTTHSSFEGLDPTSSGQPVAVVFVLCAVTMICAALLDVARTVLPFAATSGAMRRLPAPAWVGGSGGLVLAGTVVGIRAERLPHRPLDLPYGIVSQYGSGLWLAGAAVAVTALICLGGAGTRRGPVDRRSAATRALPAEIVVVAGVVAAGLAGAAAMARVYSVSTSPGGAPGSVVYRFAASGAVTRVHRPPGYSDLGTALDELRPVGYALPLGVAAVILFAGLVAVVMAGRRGRRAGTVTLAAAALFLTGLLAAQLVDDHAMAAQVRHTDPHLFFLVGWSPLLTGAAATLSLATWALAAHPEWVSGWTWPRRTTVGGPSDITSDGADLLL